MLNKFTIINQKLSPGLKKIIHNAGWLFAERVLSMVLTLSVGICVVRYLGAENFGKLSYIISFVYLFGAIAKLGLDAIVVRNIVLEEKITQEILGTAFVLKFIGSLLTITLIIYTTWILENNPQIRWMTLVVALGLLFSSFEVIEFWFQSKVLSGKIVVVRSIALILSSAAKLVFIALKLPLIAFVWLILADTFLKSLGLIWIYYQYKQSIFLWKVNWSVSINLLKESWTLILSAVMVSIYIKIDQVMLGNMTDSVAVGNYAAAVRFSEIWYFVPTIICSSVFPAIIRAKQRCEQEYYSKLQQLYDLMAWIALAIAIPMTFASGYLINALLGEDYNQAGEILALHIWAGPFVFLGVARSQWLMSENLAHFSFATTSFGVVTNILLNLLLIPAYKGSGAALATVISYAVASHVSCLFYRPMFNNAWMLTKALFIPLRLQQNLIYLSHVKKIFS